MKREFTITITGDDPAGTIEHMIKPMLEQIVTHLSRIHSEFAINFDESGAEAKILDGYGEMIKDLCSLLGMPRTRVTPQRVTKLKQRLKTYSIDELKQVAEAIGKDDFMVNGKYNNIDYLLRNDEKVDMWLQRTAAPGPRFA